MMRGGDKAAFGVLFDRYYDLLHTFARHIIKDSSVAEDIIQNVFVKMWMRKEQVNPELSVRNYLLVATRNDLAIKQIRKTISVVTLFFVLFF